MVRVLVVDDFGPWQRQINAQLGEQPNLRIIGFAANGMEAIQKAERASTGLDLDGCQPAKIEWNRSGAKNSETRSKSQDTFLECQSRS